MEICSESSRRDFYPWVLSNLCSNDAMEYVLATELYTWMAKTVGLAFKVLCHPLCELYLTHQEKLGWEFLSKYFATLYY